ncbi:unnamed protein product [Effrenium voratum]|nr:unnamed protein product [Effrenium voratum]
MALARKLCLARRLEFLAPAGSEAEQLGVATGGSPPRFSGCMAYGPIKVREFGPPEGPFIAGALGFWDGRDTQPQARRSVREEWTPVAQKLAAASFHVLAPDFHSAPAQLRPGTLSGEVLRDLFQNTLCSRNHMIPARYHSVIRPKAIVMGKSWGARMAAEVASLDDIVATALVTPALGDQDQVQSLLSQIQGRVAIALVEDDEVVDFRATKGKIQAASKGRELMWIEAKKGGHRVVEDFVMPLVEFAESARELFVHGGEL